MCVWFIFVANLWPTPCKNSWQMCPVVYHPSRTDINETEIRLFLLRRDGIVISFIFIFVLINEIIVVCEWIHSQSEMTSSRRLNRVAWRWLTVNDDGAGSAIAVYLLFRRRPMVDFAYCADYVIQSARIVNRSTHSAHIALLLIANLWHFHSHNRLLSNIQVDASTFGCVHFLCAAAAAATPTTANCVWMCCVDHVTCATVLKHMRSVEACARVKYNYTNQHQYYYLFLALCVRRHMCSLNRSGRWCAVYVCALHLSHAIRCIFFTFATKPSVFASISIVAWVYYFRNSIRFFFFCVNSKSMSRIHLFRALCIWFSRVRSVQFVDSLENKIK